MSKAARAEGRLSSWPLSACLAWAASQLSRQNGWPSWMVSGQAETAKFLTILLLKKHTPSFPLHAVGQTVTGGLRLKQAWVRCLSGERAYSTRGKE